LWEAIKKYDAAVEARTKAAIDFTPEAWESLEPVYNAAVARAEVAVIELARTMGFVQSQTPAPFSLELRHERERVREQRKVIKEQFKTIRRLEREREELLATLRAGVEQMRDTLEAADNTKGGE